jgi:hypothetical protein
MKAAIKIDGKIYTGYSHADAIMNAPHGLDLDSRESGFLTDEGEFLDRRKAFIYAKGKGLINGADGCQLQSWMIN